MNIVTGILHSGKTSILEASEKIFVRWDDWFPLYIEKEKGRQQIKGIVPDEYLEYPSLARKLLAITPSMLDKVCHAVSNDFIEFAIFADYVEVPIYAVPAVRREGDVVIIVVAPEYDELVNRIIKVRKCNADKARSMIIESTSQLDSIECDYYVSNTSELIRTYSMIHS